jgi:hypothetical protein
VRGNKQNVSGIKVSYNYTQREADKVAEMISYRLIVENLVHAIGIPQEKAVEDLIRSQDYFGQYGQI